MHRPHRAPVHRVRADRGRRGGRVRLRRADAHADDVLEAAQGARATRPRLQRDGALFRGDDSGYRGALGRVLAHRWIIGVVFVAILAGAALFQALKKELSPLEDRGFFIGVDPRARGRDRWSTPTTTQRAGRRAALRGHAGNREHLFRSSRPGSSAQPGEPRLVTFVRLKPWEERTARRRTSPPSCARSCSARCRACSRSRSIRRRSGRASATRRCSSWCRRNLRGAGKRVDALLAEARKSGAIVNADTDLKLNKPQLAVDIDREKAAASGWRSRPSATRWKRCWAGAR
jgi:multidrug efflux pump